MTYQEQFPTTAYMRHSCAFHKTQLFKDDIRQTNWARTARSFLCTDFCNVSACVRQNKGIITNLQMPITTTNFLQLKNDCITFQQMWWSTPYRLVGGKPSSAISLYRPLVLYVDCNSIFQGTMLTFKYCSETAVECTTAQPGHFM